MSSATAWNQNMAEGTHKEGWIDVWYFRPKKIRPGCFPVAVESALSMEDSTVAAKSLRRWNSLIYMGAQPTTNY